HLGEQECRRDLVLIDQPLCESNGPDRAAKPPAKSIQARRRPLEARAKTLERARHPLHPSQQKALRINLLERVDDGAHLALPPASERACHGLPERPRRREDLEQLLEAERTELFGRGKQRGVRDVDHPNRLVCRASSLLPADEKVARRTHLRPGAPKRTRRAVLLPLGVQEERLALRRNDPKSSRSIRADLQQ